jgi:hypothetical protein
MHGAFRVEQGSHLIGSLESHHQSEDSCAALQLRMHMSINEDQSLTRSPHNSSLEPRTRRPHGRNSGFETLRRSIRTFTLVARTSGSKRPIRRPISRAESGRKPIAVSTEWQSLKRKVRRRISLRDTTCSIRLCDLYFAGEALITYLQGLPKYCLWRHRSMGGNGGA